MKNKILLIAGLLIFVAASAQADSATEQEIKKLITEDNAYTKQ